MTATPLARAEIRENLLILCREHPGGITNRELWDLVQFPMLFLATGSDLPLYPIVRAGHPVAVLKEALSEAEETEMAGYLTDAAKKVAEWAQTELEQLCERLRPIWRRARQRRGEGALEDISERDFSVSPSAR